MTRILLALFALSLTAPVLAEESPAQGQFSPEFSAEPAPKFTAEPAPEFTAEPAPEFSSEPAAQSFDYEAEKAPSNDPMYTDSYEPKQSNEVPVLD